MELDVLMIGLKRWLIDCSVNSVCCNLKASPGKSNGTWII